MSEYVGHRYAVRTVLGHGGMARVYRVYDELTAREVALKQWCSSKLSVSDAAARSQSITQFEYEYRTLKQLQHPHVVSVYDYGRSERGPYFTMELLDGGDLRERAPLPWQDACRIFYDVCSSLALLHARRLIHRDVSPRNIRCHRDGSPKLIDFGAMRPMGLCQQVVGTPAFAAPEVVQGLPLDGRVDLFSLGATLYFALTGQQPSAARDFAEILQLSQHKPTPPSRVRSGIPPALDTLVLSLLNPEPALRPRTAFEVMQRLAAIGGFEDRESSASAQAYFTTPELVGRDDELGTLRERCKQAIAGHGGSLVIAGSAGMGRSRLLAMTELWANTLGACVLAVGPAQAARGSQDTHDTDDATHTLARAVLERLFDAVPLSVVRTLREEVPGLTELFEPETRQENTAVLVHARGPVRLRAQLHASGLEHAQLTALVARCLLHVSRQRPLVLTLDDAHAYPPEAQAFWHQLAEQAEQQPLLLVSSQLVPAALRGDDPTTITLTPLCAEHSAALLGSVFGHVPNLALLSDRVHRMADGNPGELLCAASWLVERGLIAYDTGTWTLPSELQLTDVPPSGAAASCAHLAELSPLARELVSTQALALRDGFTRTDYRSLAAGVPGPVIDRALAELLRLRILRAERGVYRIARARWTRILEECASETELRSRHQALAHHCLQTNQPTLHGVHHLLGAADVTAALDRLLPLLDELGDRLDLELLSELQTSPEQTATILARCLQAFVEGSDRALRPARHEHQLRRWLTLLSVVTKDEHYFSAAPGWRAQLERASGFSYLHSDPRITSPSERLRCALKRAEEEHLRTPEDQRVYSPLEAIQQLVTYVACSLAVGARRLDVELTGSLADLLEPFAALSPTVHAVWQLAIGGRQSLCRCQVEQARARWIDVYKRLDELTDASLPQRNIIRHATAYAIAASEASVGMQSALRWTQSLDSDPLQAVSAQQLRRIVRLQLGDNEGAEYFRRKAEALSVHAVAAPMFTSTIVLELVVHATGGDLLGIKQLADRIAPLADRCPSWEPYRALAAGYFARARGAVDEALTAFESCLALCKPGAQGYFSYFSYAWPLATAGLVETLIDRGDYERAARSARSGLALCRRNGVLGLSHVVVRALALAEAKRGDHAHAAELLDAISETARNRAVSGLQLGSIYEARAIVAIEAGDQRALDRYARMAAREYRYGFGSSLGARCERLLEIAALREPLLSQSWAAWTSSGKQDRSLPLATEIARAMDGAARAEGRAERALRLLCESQGASSGHLLLASERGLRFAASYGLPAPDPTLLELASARLQADLRQREDVTRVRGDTNARFETDARALDSDRQGHAFEPRVLHCVQDGKPRCAGIALLVQPDGHALTRRSAQFANVLSAYLIESGETAGL